MEALAEPGSYVDVEMAFRPLPEYELRVADVAYLSAERFAAADPDDYIHGAPDIVIEVLSPSNTAADLFAREAICLANGARQFWIVDEERGQVKVATTDGQTLTYRSGQRILLPSGGEIAVDAIFS